LNSSLLHRDRQILAGKVGLNNTTRRLSNLAACRFFETEVGLDTMVKRLLINTRDEPRCREISAVAVITDANMSEYASYLKLGTAPCACHDRDEFRPERLRCEISCYLRQFRVI
jgi:hypothetical protein